MNVSTLESPRQQRQLPSTRRPAGRSAAPVLPGTPVRPTRRSGRGTGPSARPPRPLATPVLRAGSVGAARSCAVAAPAPVVAPPSWRLTDRAIALVLVTGLVLVTAALAVVTLTAVRVTSDRYHVQGSSSVVSSADGR